MKQSFKNSVMVFLTLLALTFSTFGGTIQPVYAAGSYASPASCTNHLYSHPKGSGNRSALITLGGTVTGAGAIIDGSYGAFNATSDIAGNYYSFDFGSTVAMSELKWTYRNSWTNGGAGVPLGIYKVQASTDGSTYFDISNPTDMGASTGNTTTSSKLITIYPANQDTGYRYFRLMITATPNSVYPNEAEVEFNLCDAVAADTTAPTVNSFSATSPSSSLNIPISAFTASDDTAVTGYLITTTSTQPSSGAAGWTGTAPSTYTVGANGNYTLYPWAKDAAGNVSAVYPSPANVIVNVQNALDFDGVNDYISGSDTGLPMGNAPRTIEAWVKISGNQNPYGAVFDYGPTVTSQKSSFGVQNRAYWYGESNDVVGTTIINDGTWHHIAGSFDGTTVRLYVDGNLDAQKATTFNTVSTGTFQIGRAGGQNWWFTGQIDEIRVWNVARTQAQIQANMNSEVSPQAGLVAYYRFNQGVAGGNNSGVTTALDNSGNSLNGTLNNFALTGSTSNWVSGVVLTPPDITAPTVNTFAATSPSSSLNVPITAFNASDAVGVTGYLITTTSAQPSAGLAGWTGTAPATYTVGSYGSYTLYPWAKDAAGNVSAIYGSPASVTVCSSSNAVTSNADSGAGTLRQAIADSCSSGTITFDPSLSGQTIRLLSTLTISKNVTIDGSSLASQIIISGDADNSSTNNAGDVRAMVVSSGFTLNLSNVTIERGYANTIVNPGNTEGGAIYTEGGTVNITNSTLRSNYSPSDGGAIFIYNGTLTVKNSTFSGNTSAGWGTALYIYGGPITISNSTFSGNTSTVGSGAAILGRTGTLATTINIYNSTFSGNTSSYGGSIRNQDTATFNLYNTIVNNNSPQNCTGTIINGGNNIDDGTTCGFGSANGSKSSTNPLLNALASNGGPTQTLSLQSGSPALGAGDATTCAAAPVNSLDQRGQARPQGDASCDIGAYESNLLFDSTPPTVLSIKRQSPSSNPTNADALVFRVTFSEPVTSVGSNSFVDTGTTTPISSSVTAVTPNLVFDFTIDGIADGGNLSTLNGTVGLDVASSPTIKDLAGNILQVVEPTTDETYTVVNTIPVIVTASNQTIAYGDSDPTFTFTSNPSITFDTNPTCTVSGVHTDAGTYTISCSGASATGYSFSYVNGTLIINKATPTLSVTNSPVTYNGFPQSATVTAGSVAGSVSNILYSGSATIPTDAGSYTVDANFTPTDTANYNSLSGVSAGSFVIDQATINVTAANQTKVFGDVDPALTYTSDPLFGSDVFSGTLTRDPGENVGTYAITQGNLSAGNNYVINFTGANLGITAKTVTVTADNKAIFFGSADPSFTFGANGFLYHDAFVTDPTCSVSGAHTSVGTYPIVCSGGDAGSNYSISYVNGTFRVDPKFALMVTADDKTIKYGDADPAFTFTYSGFVGGDTNITGTAPTCSVTGAHSDAGSYPIVCSGGSDIKYDFSFTSGTLTVSQLTINVTAANKSKTYGDIDPALTYSSDALLSGDSFSGSLTRATGEDVGSHAITQGNLSAGSNYIINFTGANLNITAKAINLTADAQTKSLGTSDPALTYTSDALLGGDSFSGALTRASGESVGIYAITQGSLSAGSNYTINFTGANFTITHAVSTSVNVFIGTSSTALGNYFLTPGQGSRQAYAVDNGPARVVSTNGAPIIAALRDAWKVNGQITSFSQLMGLPKEQLSDTYLFPIYNNVTQTEQVRFANVDTVPTTVTVTIAGVVRGTYTLQPDEGKRVEYPGLDTGPVIVKSSGGVKIIAAIRDAWLVNNQVTSFAQLMGLPKEKLSDTYLFPAYNNVTLDSQIRFANVDTVATTVTVKIGGTVRGTYTLNAGDSLRVVYALDAGPVEVKSSGGAKIIAAIRDEALTSGKATSYAQIMGLPKEALSDTYLFPAYNNMTLDGQLRFANVDTIATTVTVTIGGTVRGTYNLNPGESIRVAYALDAGLVEVKSSGAKIIVALRDAWKVNSQVMSFVQLMGLPKEALSDTYWFPAYNNMTLDGQLRFAMP